MADGTAGSREIARPVLGVPPPLVATGLLAVGGVLHTRFRRHIVPRRLRFALGVPPVVAGLALAGAALRTFHRADTDERFARPTTRVVESGPYRYTRNPMYLGVTLVFAGISLAANALSALFMLPVLVLYFRFGVVAREERYLERRFGDAYRAYRSRVRRWA